MTNLAKRMLELNYPDNHRFDVETLKPTGIMTERINLLKINASQMFEAHDTFLDIGSNKGLICFLLHDRYRLLTGYEPAREICNFADDVRKSKNINNIVFVNKSFEFIDPDLKYDVVYVGNVHHYLFRNDIRAGNKPFTFLKKLKRITGKYLILDGCFEHSDFAMLGMAKDEKWSKAIRSKYTQKSFDKALRPFKRISFGFNGIGVDNSSRYTATYMT